MTNNMTFPELLAALAEMPAIPHDAREQLDATLRANFPSMNDDE